MEGVAYLEGRLKSNKYGRPKSSYFLHFPQSCTCTMGTVGVANKGGVNTRSGCDQCPKLQINAEGLHFSALVVYIWRTTSEIICMML